MVVEAILPLPDVVIDVAIDPLVEEARLDREPLIAVPPAKDRLIATLAL